MRRISVNGLLLLLLPLCGWAAPVSHWFETANRFYTEDQFDSAEVYYRRITDAGVENSDVYYNLGNACFRQDKLGEAILYYSRAQRLAPTDPDIEYNLRFARANIVDRVPEPDRQVFERVLHAFHVLLPLRSQLWVLSGLLFVLSLLFAAGLFASHNLRLWLIYLGCLVILVMGALGISAGTKIYRAETVQHAVVLARTVDAMNAPDGDQVRFTAHAGTTFQVVREVDRWVLVSLPNGVIGWVQADTIERI